MGWAVGAVPVWVSSHHIQSYKLEERVTSLCVSYDTHILHSTEHLLGMMGARLVLLENVDDFTAFNFSPLSFFDMENRLILPLFSSTSPPSSNFRTNE
jgi:hypothetical protein